MSSPAVSKMTSVVVVIVVIAAVAIAYVFVGGATQAGTTTSTSRLPPTITATVGSSTTATSATASTTLTDVTFMQPFPPTEAQTWLYYGIDHGVYAKYGLKVTVQIGSPVTVVTAVGSGKVDFGYIDPATVLLGAVNSNVTNVRSVAMISPVNQYAIVYNKATIHSLSDLNGKRFGAFPGSATGQFLPVFAKLNGLNYSSFKIVSTTSSLINSLIATGKVDFITQNINAVADAAPIAAQNNISLGAFPFAEYGLNIYGFSILATTQTITGNSNLVQRFVNASMESLVGSIHNPRDGVTSVVKLNPQLNYNTTLNGWKLLVQVGIPNANSTSYARDPLTLGWMAQQKMQQTATIVVQAYGIKNPPDASSLYTNQFVHQP